TEGRGFEPHHPPEKGKDSKRIFALFFVPVTPLYIYIYYRAAPFIFVVDILLRTSQFSKKSVRSRSLTGNGRIIKESIQHFQIQITLSAIGPKSVTVSVFKAIPAITIIKALLRAR